MNVGKGLQRNRLTMTKEQHRRLWPVTATSKLARDCNEALKTLSVNNKSTLLWVTHTTK